MGNFNFHGNNNGGLNTDDKILAFFVDDKLYGIDICSINQIIGMQPIIEITDNPDYIRGIIKYKEDIITVIDLKMRLFKKQTAESKKNCILIIQDNGCYFGVIVEQLLNIITLDKHIKTKKPKQLIKGGGSYKGKEVIKVDAQ